MASLPESLSKPTNDVNELGRQIEALEKFLSRLDGQLRQLRSSGQEDAFEREREIALRGNALLSEKKHLYRTLLGIPHPPPITIGQGQGMRRVRNK